LSIDLNGNYQLNSWRCHSNNFITKATINIMDISKSLKTSLLGPLTNAEKILTDKDETNDHDACTKLNDFITSVNNKIGMKGGLTSAQADELLSQA
jgi:hypothetical protein